MEPFFRIVHWTADKLKSAALGLCCTCFFLFFSYSLYLGVKITKQKVLITVRLSTLVLAAEYKYDSP